VFIEFPHDGMFDNVHILPRYETDCERYYPLLEELPEGSFDQVIAMGLMEHLKEPWRLVREAFRILRPGGRLYVSASSVFPVHRGPDNYYHFTRFGMREVLSVSSWKEMEISASCGPYKTIGILLQRILLQAETRFFIRPLTYLLALCIPLFDRFVIRQYHDRSFSDEALTDSLMPSNIQAIATK
jgi:SAM-dependent methyltransferase